MSVLSTNTKLIKVGQDYSAGSGISIDDGVISVTGEFGKTYSAGDNISIYEQDEQLYISSKDWANDIAEASANAYNEAVAQIPDPFDPSYISGQIDNKLNIEDFTAWQNGQYTTDLQTIEGQINNKLNESAFSEVSGSFLTAINIPESATWNEVSQAYEQASGTYLTSHQSLDGYATQDWVQDQGYLTGVSIPESATWQDVSTTVQTNSAQWAEGGVSPSGFVSGSNAVFVPYPWTPDQGNVYSATISGDVIVSTGHYYNSGADIIISNTYSLSEIGSQIGEIGSQIGDKLDENVIKNSKTLAIIDDKAEVYSFAYKPKEFVSTGITIDNRSSPSMVQIYVETQPPYSLYSASLVIESDGFDEYSIPDGWDFVNSANGSATFSRFYKNKKSDRVIFPAFWSYNLTNASAYVLACDGLAIDELAFKSDLTGQGGNPEVESYVRTNSGAIDETVNAVQSNSASWGTGSTPTYDYTDNNLISAIDSSGLFARGLHIGSRIGRNIYCHDGIMGLDSFQMWLNPDQSHFAITSGIFGPLDYATGATITFVSSGSPAPNRGQIFGGFFKGNEWYVSNATAGQALRGETHLSRGVHLSGATTAGTSFDLSVNCVSGKSDTANGYNWKLERDYVRGNGFYGSWKYGHAEDTLLRSVSSSEVNTYVQNNSATIDEVNSTVQTNSGAWGQGGGGDVPTGTMNVSGLEYNAVNEISAYNGSALTDVNLNNIVQTNSGAWGGSALPISAGPGISLSMVDGVLVISVTGGN